MFWSIFTQCVTLIGALVAVGGAVGWLAERRSRREFAGKRS